MSQAYLQYPRLSRREIRYRVTYIRSWILNRERTEATRQANSVAIPTRSTTELIHAPKLTGRLGESPQALRQSTVLRLVLRPLQPPPPHEIPIPKPRQMPLAAVANHRHHAAPRPRAHRRLHGPRHVERRAGSDEDPLLPEQPVGHVHRLLIGHPDGVVQDARVVPPRKVVRDPIESDPLGEGVVPVPEEGALALLIGVRDPVLHLVVQGRAGGVDEYHPNRRVPLLEVAARSRDRAAGAAGHDERVDPAAGVVPNLLARPGVMHVEVGPVFELIHERRPDRPARSGLWFSTAAAAAVHGVRNRPRRVHVMIRIRNGAVGHDVNDGAQALQHGPLFRGLIVGHDNDDGMSPGGAEGREGYARGSGGSLHDDSAGAGATRGGFDGTIHRRRRRRPRLLRRWIRRRRRRRIRLLLLLRVVPPGGAALRAGRMRRRDDLSGAQGGGKISPPLGLPQHAERGPVLPGPPGIVTLHLDVDLPPASEQRREFGQLDQWSRTDETFVGRRRRRRGCMGSSVVVVVGIFFGIVFSSDSRTALGASLPRASACRARPCPSRSPRDCDTPS
mmetsp:Transcript_7894/g.23340  ORF Transcript_7894/g.23340 Transcript_7894/m.23340 type:complete len:561 (+) Transcript_7894:330-2012(+)